MAAGAAGSLAGVLMGYLWDKYHSGDFFAAPLIGILSPSPFYGLVYPRLLEKSAGLSDKLCVPSLSRFSCKREPVLFLEHLIHCTPRLRLFTMPTDFDE